MGYLLELQVLDTQPEFDPQSPSLISIWNCGGSGMSFFLCVAPAGE